MSLSKLRLLAQIAAAGGVCWVVFAAAALLSSNGQDTRPVLSTTGDYFGFGLFALCLALTVPALLALHLHHRGTDGRLGRAGAVLAIAGAGAQCIVISGIVANGEETSWFGVTAPIAILTWVVGSVVLGIAIRRARLLPGWVGIALPVATLFAIVGSDYGTSALIGVFQIVVGLRIAGTAEAAKPVPAAVGRLDARA
ncbi:MAG: hypothetical protein KY433_09640 [Actinobacteria bacterium]|nr:hypothetical protein [Actinomycetota bacterium]